LTITAAPPAAIAHAIARPILRAPPVTRATFPASSAAFAMSRRNVPELLEIAFPAKKQGGLLRTKKHEHASVGF
jgi:hypothetical protein